MSAYHRFWQLKALHAPQGLHTAQIAGALGLDPRTVAYWLRPERLRPRRSPQRASQREPFKPLRRQRRETYP